MARVRNILISNIDSAAGIHLAAYCLASSEDSVSYLAPSRQGPSQETIVAEVRDALDRISPVHKAGESALGMSGRLRRVEGGHNNAELEPASLTFRADQVWYLDQEDSPALGRGAEPSPMRELLAILPDLGATEFNYVGQKADPQIEEFCLAHRIGYRSFSPSLIAGEDRPSRKARHDEFLWFLQTLHYVKSEIEERLPDYFELQALRCYAPAGAHLNLIGASQATEMMVRIARRQDTLGHDYRIAAPLDANFASLCERVGRVYGLSLLASDDRSELNAIDRIFDERLGRFHRYLTLPPRSARHGHEPKTEASMEGDLFNEEAQLDFFRTVHRNQEAARIARRQRVDALPAILTKRTISRDELDLTYYVGGADGSTVVLLNALGQRLDYWYRLVEQLMLRHKIIIWELRGTTSPHPFRLGDQVDDLDSILRQEACDVCHLACWCTGPKIAVEFYLRRPDAMASMVFLNSTFKCCGVAQEFETDYEHNLESLCKVVDSRPATAGSAMEILQAGIAAGEAVSLQDMEGKALADHVLSLINVNLKPYLLAPFRTKLTTLNYVRQLIDFWSHDTMLKASQVKIPVLLIGAERDQVASPLASQASAQLFPRARYVEVQSATHYCLYDRPELIADLMEAFFDDPKDTDQFSHQWTDPVFQDKDG